MSEVIDRLKHYYLTEEPNFVEGERVEAINRTTNGQIQNGDKGTVIVEFILELGGEPIGFHLLGIILDKNKQKIFGPDLDSRWRTL